MAEISSSSPTLGQRVRDVRLIERALTRAVQEALLRHKQAGNPVAIWRNGQTVWLGPDEIPLSGSDRNEWQRKYCPRPRQTAAERT